MIPRWIDNMSKPTRRNMEPEKPKLPAHLNLSNDQLQLEMMKALINNTLSERGDDKKVVETPWWVKVFGGTILIMTSTLVVGAFQTLYSKTVDLENTIRASADKYIRQEDFNNKMQAQWNAVKELQAQTPKVVSQEEKIKSLEANVIRIEKDIKLLTAENSKLRERLAALDKKPPVEDK